MQSHEMLRHERIDLSEYSENWIKEASYEELKLASDELFTLAQDLECEADVLEAYLDDYDKYPSLKKELQKQISTLRLNSLLADSKRLDLDFATKSASFKKVIRKHERISE